MRLLRLAAGFSIGTVLLGAAACGSSEAGSDDSAPAATSAAVQELEAGPSAIPITTPLPQKPEPGGTIVFLKCEVPQCAQQADGFEAAAAAVGWESIDVPFVTTDPSSLDPAFRQALALKPAAVAFGGMPYELWKRYIPEFEAAGTIIVPNFDGDFPLSDTAPVSVAGPTNDKAMAKSLVEWVAADSGGDAHVLVQSVGAYESVSQWATFFAEDLEDACPDCESTKIEASATQITGAGATQAIVSELRRDPSINYVVTYNGAFIGGLNQAIKNAQLDVKVGGLFPLPQNVQDITNGSGGAFLAVNNPYTAWASLDTALRHVQGAPVLPLEEQTFPVKLVTEASAEESDGDYKGPADFEEQFKKLWQVG